VGHHNVQSAATVTVGCVVKRSHKGQLSFGPKLSGSYWSCDEAGLGLGLDQGLRLACTSYEVGALPHMLFTTSMIPFDPYRLRMSPTGLLETCSVRSHITFKLSRLNTQFFSKHGHAVTEKSVLGDVHFNYSDPTLYFGSSCDSDFSPIHVYSA